MRMSSLKACMGGWCHVRGSCGHYHAADRREPEERLCAPGDRAHLGWHPIAMSHAPRRLAKPVELVTRVVPQQIARHGAP